MITDMWMIWLAVAILLVIIEIFTMSAIALSLAFGVLGGFVATLCGGSFEIQLIAMAFVMIASLIVVPKLFRYYGIIKTPTKESTSNMDALVGRRSVVEPVAAGVADQGPRVKIDGDRWLVRTEDYAALLPGQKVEVMGYDSIILIVRPIK